VHDAVTQGAQHLLDRAPWPWSLIVHVGSTVPGATAALGPECSPARTQSESEANDSKLSRDASVTATRNSEVSALCELTILMRSWRTSRTSV